MQSSIFPLQVSQKRVKRSRSETVEQFVMDLKLLVRDCSFKEPDGVIRDRIVFGTNSRKIREKLINEGKELTMGNPKTLTPTDRVRGLPTDRPTDYPYGPLYGPNAK